MYGESTANDAYAVVDQKNAGRFIGAGQQHSAQRVRRYSASRGRSSSNLLGHSTPATATNNAVTSNQLFNIDNLLMDDDYSMLDTSAYDDDQHDSGLFERSTYDHAQSVMDGSVSSHSVSSSISSPEIQWLSDDDEDATLAHNFSDPEVDQITTATPSHISDRALRALSRAPQYHSTF